MTAQRLVRDFDPRSNPPGWHDLDELEETQGVYDGLTLQIYAELLRAEDESGLELPPEILTSIPAHLRRC